MRRIPALFLGMAISVLAVSSVQAGMCCTDNNWCCKSLSDDLDAATCQGLGGMLMPGSCTLGPTDNACPVPMVRCTGHGVPIASPSGHMALSLLLVASAGAVLLRRYMRS